LKHGQNSRMVYLSGRADSGVRLVHVFRLVDAASQFTDDAAWVVPESALVVKGLDSAGVLEINRFGSRYFVASDQPSQLAGGLVSSAGLYGMSVGVRDPEAVQVIGDEDFLNTMRRSLRLLSIVDWLGFLNQPRMLLRLARLKRPAAIAATIVASYLLLASAWLWWVTQTREAAANALSPSVSTLLQKQRRIDEFAAEYAVIAERWSQRQAGVVVWWLAAEVWKQNGAVTSASFANGEAVLQGTAQSATGLLSSLSEAPSVESVRFNGPVTRLSDEAEQFSLTVKMRDDSYLGGGDRAP
jgi:hypothetical protein